MRAICLCYNPIRMTCIYKGNEGMRGMSIKFDVRTSPQAWTQAAADIVCQTVRDNERPVLVLPTGGTPVPMYAELVRRYRASEISFQKVTSFNLDEYVGLERSHPESYYSFMHRNFFDAVDVPAENIHLPDGRSAHPDEACAAYNAMLDEVGAVDLAVLGIGHNGHIGFNEPGADPAGRTHCETLSLQTRQANARFFEDDLDKVPTHALTMGLGDILKAKKILLLANGEAKAAIIRKAFQGPVTREVPCSLLQNHPNVVVLLDEGAASLLEKA